MTRSHSDAWAHVPQRRQSLVVTHAVWNSGGRRTPAVPADPLEDTPAINEAARKALSKAAGACRRVGWFSFWTQLTLSVVSAVILLFSVAFTAQARAACMRSSAPPMHTTS